MGAASHPLVAPRLTFHRPCKASFQGWFSDTGPDFPLKRNDATMTTRIIIQLLLLPLVLLAVPLMFSLAWVQEALSELRP
jgi:hypothetical protein